MSDIQTGLVVFLNTKSGVTDLVSNRIRPIVLIQNETMPAITVTEFATTHYDKTSGAAGMFISRIRIDCYAATRVSCNAVAEAVRAELHGYRGAAGSETIASSQLDNRLQDVLAPNDASDERLYRIRQSWRMHITESIPI